MFWLENHREDDGNFGLINPAALGGGSSNSSNGIDWNSIINQSFAIGSQAIAGWGRNPTTQIAHNQSQGVFAIQSNPNQSYQQQTYNPYANMTPAEYEQYKKNTLGGGLGSGLDQTIKWATENPMIVFAAIAGVYLLMREPPKRR